MAKSKNPVSFQEFDLLVLESTFTSEGNIRIRRMQDKIKRGVWVFKFVGKCEWECIKSSDPFLRDNFNSEYSFGTTNVPEAIRLKAREFLIANLAVKPSLT